MENPILVVLLVIIIVVVVALAITVVYLQTRRNFRETKNYERGLKMVPLLIHLPPISEDVETGSRDERDIAEEAISQAQVMYNVIASTATSGLKSKFFGQRHISFEIVAKGGYIRYYAVVPTVLVETIRQAVAAAYPTARLEEVESNNLFNEIGKISGTIGGEFTLKKEYDYPIATYQESKRDVMRAIINAMSSASKEDGLGIQILMRPADSSWSKSIEKTVKNIKEGKKKTLLSGGGLDSLAWFGEAVEALWKPPSTEGKEATATKEISGANQEKIEALEEKARYAGFETLIRVITSSNSSVQSQTLLQNVVSAFSLFDSPTKNGLKFTMTKNIEKFVTSYIFRFFPQESRKNILNTVELATIFHFPDQSNIPTSKVERQATKQVDGPSNVPEEGLLLGYNLFRGVKKPIRISEMDRRRHTYFIGATGSGKSTFLKNLALQDMIEGRGFAFVDPHGDAVEDLLSLVPENRYEDVILFDPGNMENPVGINIFETKTDDEKDFIIQECINMLYSLYDPGHTGIFGPIGEHMFRNAALLLMNDPEGGTWIDIPRVFRDPEYVKSKLQHIKDQRVIDYWTKEFPSSQRSNEAGSMITWFISKWGPFESNAIMRNIMGQVKSGFNIREIMDNKKILFVNLSKGKMGELNSRLIGMFFVMKFQTAAMSRVDTPEEEREDFCLFVDEFQNFATESFESILSEARKYKLNLVVANQFMTQLTDQIREAIIGNIGAVVCGRIGVTDAELMIKKFTPVFEVSDLQNMPNFEAAVQILIGGVPTSPFTMSIIPPMGKSNPEVAKYVRQLSGKKYGQTRAQVEKEINDRYVASSGMSAVTQNAQPEHSKGSFLDEWLAKRQTIKSEPKTVPEAPGEPIEPIDDTDLSEKNEK